MDLLLVEELVLLLHHEGSLLRLLILLQLLLLLLLSHDLLFLLKLLFLLFLLLFELFPLLFLYSLDHLLNLLVQAAILPRLNRDHKYLLRPAKKLVISTALLHAPISQLAIKYQISHLLLLVKTSPLASPYSHCVSV